MQELQSNTLTAWITALIVFAAVFSAFYLLKTVVRRRAATRAVPPSHLQELFTDLVRRTRLYFIVIIALWGGSLALTLNQHHEHIWHLVVMVGVLLQAGIWAGGLVQFWSERIAERRAADASTRMTINVIAIAARLVLWTIVLLVILDNLGINVTALVTGLGIGGIAIALAVQNILSDLFAALSIVLDKPFVVGDAINVGDAGGTVEHIGLKSTRLRSDSGEMIIISNGDLLKSRIRNFRGQEKRLVVLKLGIAYGTPPEKLARVPDIIRAVAEKEKSVKFDRSNFTTFGIAALITESVYSVYKLSYAEYMNTQQRINLEIYRQLSAEEIEIAHQPPVVTTAPGEPIK
ncbi:MAG TPA: mechanosensitive ion channel family protein [Gemmatimonadaceae bacterium]|nr:mechanosensitive ion channel family protein [Gemmatimonadaceae bacterium]